MRWETVVSEDMEIVLEIGKRKTQESGSEHESVHYSDSGSPMLTDLDQHVPQNSHSLPIW